jgi:hypothetical protein
MKMIMEERDDVVFFIKLLPLRIHPAAYAKAKSIICEKSLGLLEWALDGREIPEPRCETTAVDDTIELAERLGISGTPTMVLPDGAVIKGYKDAITLMSMVEEAGRAVEQKETEEALKAMDMEMTEEDEGFEAETEESVEAEGAEEPVEAEGAEEPIEAEGAEEPIEAEGAEESAEEKMPSPSGKEHDTETGLDLMNPEE